MHLIELRDLLQKLSDVGPKSTVVEHRVAWEPKAIHILSGGPGLRKNMINNIRVLSHYNYSDKFLINSIIHVHVCVHVHVYCVNKYKHYKCTCTNQETP